MPTNAAFHWCPSRRLAAYPVVDFVNLDKTRGEPGSGLWLDIGLNSDDYERHVRFCMSRPMHGYMASLFNRRTLLSDPYHNEEANAASH